MATTNQHISARNDPDLLARFVAAAEMLGVDNASQWVQENMGRLVATEVDAGQSVADVHAYATLVRNTYIAATPERPGLSLSAVTDSHMATAIQAVASADGAVSE